MITYTYSANQLIKIIKDLSSSYWYIGLMVFCLKIVTNWMILEKAHEEGWKQFIPIYNLYINFKLYWKKSRFWLLLIGPIVLVIMIPVVYVMPDTTTKVLWLLGVIGMLLYIALFAIILNFKKAKAFGKNAAFGFGLLFFELIFNCIIAFDKRIEYQRNK